MVFSSISFLFYFLPVVIVVYNLAPCRLRNAVLLAASLFFYAWGEPVYVILMIASILFNYAAGRKIYSLKEKGGNTGVIFVLAVAFNLALLGFFKYADFVTGTINSVVSFAAGADVCLIRPLELPLPIGISFYTFQALSYIIDLRRGNVKLQKNLIDFGTYVALFPQLIAGPIVRIKTIEEQLSIRPKNPQLFAEGTMRFITGFSKKILIANNMGSIWESVQDLMTMQMTMQPGTGMSVLTAWLGALSFTMQIYFDFSGYSDMAIGLGRMFGFEFPENFRYPYISKSITEFWRRWHISLSTWFREYLYIPLGGNRHGLLKQLRNIFVVWMLTGLWHGASWNFVVWGLYFGLLLVVEKLFLLRYLEKAPAWLAHTYSMFFVIISWVIFACDDMGTAFELIGNMFGRGGSFADETGLYLLCGNMILFVIAILGSTSLVSGLWLRFRLFCVEKNRGTLLNTVTILIAAAGLIVSTAFMVSSTYNPFLYFRF
ncbi:MAG: MBOAT family protein [Clostridia bacterium]|nr:MBOAT family protein [Clostridia bacterium]